MDGMQLLQPNIGINQFDTAIGTYPLSGDLTSEEVWDESIEGCISDTFVVSVDEEIVFSLTLTESCKFFFVDYQSKEQINGGYSILNTVTKGGMSTIDFFINDGFVGEAIIAWPVEDGLCLIIDGIVLRKKKK